MFREWRRQLANFSRPQSSTKNLQSFESLELILAIEGNAISIATAHTLSSIFDVQKQILPDNLADKKINNLLNDVPLNSLLILGENQIHKEFDLFRLNGYRGKLLIIFFEKSNHNLPLNIDQEPLETRYICHFPFDLYDIVNEIIKLEVLSEENLNMTQDQIVINLKDYHENFQKQVVSYFMQIDAFFKNSQLKKEEFEDFHDLVKKLISNLNNLMVEDYITAHQNIVIKGKRNEIKTFFLAIKTKVENNPNNYNYENHQQIDMLLKNWEDIKSYRKPLD